MQALVGLWQIFVRQGSIAAGRCGRQRWPNLLAPFAKIQNEREIFDGGRAGVQAAAEGHALAGQRIAAGSHDRSAGGHRAPATIPTRTSRSCEDMIRIFEAQRLVSLTTLFDLADNLESVARGEKLNTALAGKLAVAHLRDPVAAQRADVHGKELACPSATGPRSTSKRSAS